MPSPTPPTQKTREEISNKLYCLAEKKKRLSSVAANFRSGRNDAAIATDILIIENRMYELYWVLNQAPQADA